MLLTATLAVTRERQFSVLLHSLVPQANNVGPKNGQIDVPQHKLAQIAQIAQVATLVTDPYERISSVQF